MVRATLCILVAVGVSGLAGCGSSSPDANHKLAQSNSGENQAGTAQTPAESDPVQKSTQSESSAATSANADAVACKPTCGSVCDVDDGCGAKCHCATGESCVDQICVNPACGPCRPNERCNAGKCECVPDCERRACLPDGCGAICDCPPNLVVNAPGQTVAPADCKDTCDASGWKCGALCGVSCGQCAQNEACNLGKCQCAPHCDGTTCSDGCGGSCDCPSGTVCNRQQVCSPPEACADTCASMGATCGTVCGATCANCDTGQACIDGQCREGLSCSDCGLQLRLLERTVIAGKIARVVLGVEFADSNPTLAPRLLDLWVTADRTVELVDAQAGPSMVETGKSLFKDEVTRNPWQRRPDKAYQLLGYTLTGTKRLKPGRIMTLTFDLAEPGPVRFMLQRHAQTFAPLDADSALQATRYDEAVVVSQ